MSALAARRAAALLASQHASSPSSSAPTPKKPRTPLPSPSPEIDESDSEGESSTSPSPPPPPPSSKKRKLRKSSPPPDIAPRYGSTPQHPEPTSGISQSARSTRQRRFSPSAPAEIPDSVSGDESDSSVGDSDADLAEEGMNDVDEGRAQWSLPVTSVESTPGPSRVRARPSMQDSTSNTSNFIPIEGVNIHKISEDELKSAGLKDDYSGDGMIINLSREETLIIAGTYTLTPLSGSISISSCTLSPNGSSHPIFAPTSHPIPIISSSSTATQKNVPWLKKLKLSKEFKQGQNLFLVRENQCGIDGLRYGAIPGFAHIWLEEVGSWGLKGVHPVTGSFSTPIYPHVTPPTWSKAVNSLPSAEEAIEQPFVGLVKGPKRSGKSTFARAVLNNLLKRYGRAAWLECDLGQGEFSAGGVVGLWVLDKQVLGPSFTHPLIPYRAHYLGTYTPLTCPDEYLAALKHLLEIYKFDIQHSFSSSSPTSSKINNQVPLVINTQGWVKGLGEDLLRSIEGMSEPTHIYSFTSPYRDDENPYVNGNGWTTSPPYQTSFLPDPYADGQSNTVKHTTLDSAPITPLQARFSAADFRVLSILSYFYSSLPSTPFSDNMGSRIRWGFTKPLTYLTPWEIEYGPEGDKAINKIYMIGEGSEGIVPEDLGLALNGAVVALIDFLNPHPSFEEDDEEGVYVQGRQPPSLDDINFLGLGLIRYIEPFSSTGGKIHILTPLPPEVLGRCKGLIKNGAIEIPTPGLLDWLNPPRSDGEIPFFDKSGVEVVGGERRRWRKNIMRKGM
ncbi:hypothetical protein I302_106889 [Kwoniella bestiolae CBS 10118]|uniref:Polynucleotide 5'-hydroxyl-kinase GRC3 n=1 Tax=Kwoniella bestiolae CBS 10118 TaxID=1296100 RepID=A0A1B9G043_9TREE|nr:hypothetical protein I302_05845 [Kwoniella bestiolae CBS 10118]OCF24385.1 hypothetical protein I302_05845 [Kwoniella bestiolae CBS 10118]